MLLTITQCTSRKHFQDFFNLPYTLNKHNKSWVPPLRIMTKRILSPQNPFFKKAEIVMWVAYRNNRVVGRIACVINQIHNQYYGEKVAFWGFFESEESEETAAALFSKAELWAKNKGMHSIQGPMNPSINYECGLQISGFNDAPFVMMPQNPSYYPALVEKQGYQKTKDLLAWRVTRENTKIHARKVEIIQEIQREEKIKIRPAKISRFSDEIKSVAEIYNDAWCENWGYLPLDLDELNYLVSDLKPFLDPNYIFIAEKDGEPCGFSVSIPDINQAVLNIRNGRLLPFNFMKLLWQIKIRKQITQHRIPLLGVLKKFQHIPVGVMLYNEYIKNIHSSKYHQAELSWILEDNQPMLSGLKLMNAQHYKTYRIYQKNLDLS